MHSRRILASLILPLALGTALLIAPAGHAARAPTSAEATAIRAAALGALQGPGWQVSHIRVSTVPTSNRYATAIVANRATGVSGEMILRTRGGRWSKLFLGTNDFCTVSAPRAVLDDLGFACGPRPRLRVRPTAVTRGGTLTLTGTDFRVREKVWLGIGPPQSEATHFATTRSDAVGNFRGSIKISRRAALGRFVIIACQRACRLKAGATFRIVAG